MKTKMLVTLSLMLSLLFDVALASEEPPLNQISKTSELSGRLVDYEFSGHALATIKSKKGKPLFFSVGDELCFLANNYDQALLVVYERVTKLGPHGDSYSSKNIIQSISVNLGDDKASGERWTRGQSNQSSRSRLAECHSILHSRFDDGLKGNIAKFGIDKTKQLADKAITLVSYNIRNGKAEDGDDHWNKRKHLVVDMIQGINPSLIGLQEAYPFQTQYLLSHFPDFTSVGVARNGKDSESVNILVDNKRFDIVDSGTFWLSNTPDAQSLTWWWGAFIHRICTWVLLQDKASGKSFYFFNTHFDHFSSFARKFSAQLLLEKIAARKHAFPYIVGGDLNALADDEPLQILLNPNESNVVLRDSFEIYPFREDAPGTFNGFDKDDKYRIDFLLVSPEWKLNSMNIHTEKLQGQYPSDHFPISVKLQ